MTDNINVENLDKLLDDQQKRNDEIIAHVVEDLKKSFPDEKQHQVIADIYKQVFKLSYNLEELNHQGIFLSSYIDAFYTHLVGEGKLITEDDYVNAAREAYRQSLETVTQAAKEMAEKET